MGKAKKKYLKLENAREDITKDITIQRLSHHLLQFTSKAITKQYIISIIISIRERSNNLTVSIFWGKIYHRIYENQTQYPHFK